MNTTPCKTPQSGFTLIELLVATSLAMLVLGTIILVQKMAHDGFDGSLNESRMTRDLREGMNELKVELRAALDDSIVTAAWNGADGDALLTFQNAVDFNLAQGATQWGAEGIVDGTIEYTVIGGSLVRRVRNDTGQLQNAFEETLVRDLDMTGAAPPVSFEWDPAMRVVRLTVRTRKSLGGRDVARLVEAVIHVESVYNF
ncbi:MAG: prepilin-type N-terminal cleavage/methylation domain-containing protein [Planctomycetes bacterium]|nr:prepilin-type N-terminal cleavage/methylation domain-containing protein [Planctomycetota bacterium]